MQQRVVVVDVKAEDDTDYGVDFGARRSFALLLFGGSIMTTSFCHTVILVRCFSPKKTKKERKKKGKKKKTHNTLYSLRCQKKC